MVSFTQVLFAVLAKIQKYLIDFNGLELSFFRMRIDLQPKNTQIIAGNKLFRFFKSVPSDGFFEQRNGKNTPMKDDIHSCSTNSTMQVSIPLHFDKHLSHQSPLASSHP